MWLSLICRNVKPVASAAWASPSRLNDFGTPPESVHNMPVPAQIMHSSAPRRLMLSCSSVSFSLITISLLGRGARENDASLKETRRSSDLFPATEKICRGNRPMVPTARNQPKGAVMIVVIGHLQIPPERMDQAKAAIASVVTATLKEPGCLLYAFSQDALEPGTIRITEKWESWDALKAHA